MVSVAVAGENIIGAVDYLQYQVFVGLPLSTDVDSALAVRIDKYNRLP